jgi:murein DD-endopeptidase MepM/ murein hydrolase activator NlpD
MIIKRDMQEFSTLFFIGVVFTLISITTLLITEYYFFAEQFKKMTEYKRMYRSYALLYKRMIDHEQQGLFARSPVQQFFDTKQFLISSNMNEIDTMESNDNDPIEDKSIQKKSIRFQWPIEREYFWLSSTFGPRKKPNGTWGYHYGIDMAASQGTPVRAASAGVVIEAAYSNKGYGKTVVIDHADGSQTRYAHMHAIQVKVGAKVRQGDQIGLVGNTGFVRGENGTHLHFEVKKGTKYIDPLSVLA